MGRRFQYILEIIILLTLFSLFSSFTITTYQTDRIVEITEEFTELVRYKGCITKDMYLEYLQKYPCPVSISFIVEKAKALSTSSYMSGYRFTNDILTAVSNDQFGKEEIDLGTVDAEHLYYLESNPEQIYKNMYVFDVGDSIQIIVRKQGRSYFDTIISAVSHMSTRSDPTPIVAVKGGLILNAQYE